MQPGLLLLSCAVLVALGLPAGAAPDEDLLGKAAGYPVGSRATWFYDERVRVGSFSHLDSILQHYTLKKAVSARPAAENFHRAQDRVSVRTADPHPR